MREAFRICLKAAKVASRFSPTALLVLHDRSPDVMRAALLLPDRPASSDAHMTIMRHEDDVNHAMAVLLRFCFGSWTDQQEREWMTTSAN